MQISIIYRRLFLAPFIVNINTRSGPGGGWQICSGHLECQDIV